jgi:hypothetical protein
VVLLVSVFTNKHSTFLMFSAESVIAEVEADAVEKRGVGT